MDLELPGRITDFIDKTNDCWLWTKSHTSAGRPQVWFEGKNWLVYRLMYEHLVGPIPEGLTLDHVVCDNGRCCNPHHCKPTSNGANAARALEARWASGTACPQGHPYAQYRRYRKSPGRVGDAYCVGCGNERSKQWHRQRAAQLRA